MAYKTLMHATFNESGKQEVEIVYENGFFRWLFRMPDKVEIYVGGGVTWYRKDTHEKADRLKVSEILDIVTRIRLSTAGV